jgi:outer membrane protein TolC
VTRAARVRSGYHHEICGAKKQFHQKLFENRRQWQDLTVRLNNARMRLDYAQSLEGIQLEKLRAERERQSYGKSTTYQVFLFQQDYANAQIARLLIQDEILQLMTQLKSYGV